MLNELVHVKPLKQCLPNSACEYNVCRGHSLREHCGTLTWCELWSLISELPCEEAIVFSSSRICESETPEGMPSSP